VDASSADEALAIFRERKEQIHLVLTDVMLAKTTAPQLIEKVRAMCPQVKVLLMSGYAGEAVVQQGFGRQDIPFIQKPFSVHDLARKVRDVLESAPLAH
jgi:DNA-binding NtrC family response regulator